MYESAYLKQIKHNFGYLLLEYNFILKSHEDAESFDNECTYFTSKHLILRIIRERGVVWIEVTPNPSSSSETCDFFDFEILREDIDGDSYQKLYLSESTQIKELAKQFKSYYSHIIEMFSIKNQSITVTRLNKLLQTRAKRIFG
jgi:hypothetical protein